MKQGVIRIGVVTAQPEVDWHSERLLATCGRRGEAVAIDRAVLAARVQPERVEVLAGAAPAAAFDAFLLARGLGRCGDGAEGRRAIRERVARDGAVYLQGILEATGLMAEAVAEHVLGRALRRRQSSDHIVRGRTTGAIHG